MATGPFNEEDLGIKCYHSKVGAVELLLNHLIDSNSEYVIVDMTAGADSFASGMFTKFDTTFVIVEPTLKSISVYDQYKHYAQDYNVVLKVIGNKVDSQDDIDFIKERVGDDYLTSFHNSQFVKTMERGKHQTIDKLETENSLALDSMLESAIHSEKNWDQFYKHTIEFHIKNAKSWANSEAGEDLSLQVDPDFSLKQAINS